MPLISRLMIRTGLGYLLAAMLVGLVSAFPEWAFLRPTWIHLLVVGWLTQLIFGVAIWLFPRSGPEAPWGNTRLAWAGYLTLNAGLLLRLVAEPWPGLAVGAPLLTASAGSQAIGILALVAALWPRVRGK